MTSLAVLFGHGAYWARTLEAIELLVEDLLVVVRGAPPGSAAEYSAELRSYSLYHHQRFEQAAVDDEGESGEDQDIDDEFAGASSCWISVWSSFLEVANGHLLPAENRCAMNTISESRDTAGGGQHIIFI